MKEFSTLLTDTDQMAVLCVLSHGTRDCVYGSDGRVVSRYTLRDCLNNGNCTAMLGKPKILIIQACLTGK